MVPIGAQGLEPRTPKSWAKLFCGFVDQTTARTTEPILMDNGANNSEVPLGVASTRDLKCGLDSLEKPINFEAQVSISLLEKNQLTTKTVQGRRKVTMEHIIRLYGRKAANINSKKRQSLLNSVVIGH